MKLMLIKIQNDDNLLIMQGFSVLIVLGKRSAEKLLLISVNVVYSTLLEFNWSFNDKESYCCWIMREPRNILGLARLLSKITQA